MSKRDNVYDNFHDALTENGHPEGLVLKARAVDKKTASLKDDGITMGKVKKRDCGETQVIDVDKTSISAEQFSALVQDMGLSRDGLAYMLDLALRKLAQDIATAGDSQARATTVATPREAMSQLVKMGIISPDEFTASCTAAGFTE